MSIPKTIGLEIELLAPEGLSRYDLAVAIAQRIKGKVRRFFHVDSEPSKVPQKPLFYHLTLGFEVLDQYGQWFVRCVDDITLRHDLNKKAVAKKGWYRIVSDDARLIRLIQTQTDADSALADCLSGVGRLFGTEPIRNAGDVYRLATCANEPIALAAPMPGERERACELITAPLPYQNYAESLALLLAEVNALGFYAPKEGATHIHFDGEAFTSASMLVQTMNRLHDQRLYLRRVLNTNPACKRIGAWSEEVMAVINQADFAELSWPQARQRLAQQNISKYCDFNIRNLVYPQADKHTFEVRILPVYLEPEPIQSRVQLLHTLLFPFHSYSFSDQ